MEHTAPEKFVVRIEEGKYLFMNTVTHIAAFSQTEVMVATASGRLAVEGDDLKIESLDKNRGEITVSGRIEAVFLHEKKDEKGSLLTRLFK